MPAPAEGEANSIELRYMSKRFIVTVWEHLAGEWTPDLFADAFALDLMFVVWQKELCPTSARAHWHIYMRFKGRKRAATVLEKLPRGTHIDRCNGDEAACTAYCEKTETRIEAGERRGTYVASEGKQGARSDLEAIKTAVLQGASLKSIASDYSADFIRYHGGITKMQALLAPPPPVFRDVTVTVLWGATGTGKTHRILTTYPDAYEVSPGRDPWSNYTDQKIIFFDEFNQAAWTMQQMNKYLDKWRCILDSRYNNKYAYWTTVFIVMNCDPMTLYVDQNEPMLLEAFRRRIMNRCWQVPDRTLTIEELTTSCLPSMPHNRTYTFGAI